MAGSHVHPTALLSPETEVGEGARVGPYVVTEGPVLYRHQRARALRTRAVTGGLKNR